mmetsp:Transcript_21908/g.67278  ORF Transcript_21908/g.67278 Transcript_21908/m.67278 type:complete len:210 (+) Transcript_21908:1685-2314(+)
MPLSARGRDREAAHALLGPAPVVEVIVGGEAEALAGLEEGPAQRVLVGHLLHLDGAALAVELGGAVVVVLVALVIREQLVGAPLFAAGRLPGSKVRPRAAGVEHGVEAARTAEGLAAAHEDGAAGGARLALGPEGPVEAAVEELRESRRRIDLDAIRLVAGLDHEHAAVLILREAVRQHAAGGAAAHDDVVVAKRARRRDHLADGHAGG